MILEADCAHYLTCKQGRFACLERIIFCYHKNTDYSLLLHPFWILPPHQFLCSSLHSHLFITTNNHYSLLKRKLLYFVPKSILEESGSHFSLCVTLMGPRTPLNCTHVDLCIFSELSCPKQRLLYNCTSIMTV